MLNISKLYLQKIGKSILINDFEDNYLSHPDYPSLYAISDSLNKIDANNFVANVPKEYIKELPKFFIAEVEGKIVFIEKKNNQIIVFLENNQQINIKEEDFVKNWSGLTLIIEEEVIQKSKNKLSKNHIQHWLIFVIIGIIFLFIDIKSIVIGFKIISLLGLVTSYFLWKEFTGNQNKFLEKLCNQTNKTSCNSVINSEEKIFNKISFLDVTICYFLINFFMLFFNGELYKYIGLLSILSFPIIFYSIYLQHFKIKKYCVLCVFVSSLLILQSVLFYYSYTPINIQINDVFIVLLIVFIVTSLWYFIKEKLMLNSLLKVENYSLLRIKKNIEVFKILNPVIENKNVLETLQPILFGKINAKSTLSLFLSPYCKHCFIAFEESMKLLEKLHDDVNVNIFFNVNP
jgi:hypothetical protein